MNIDLSQYDKVKEVGPPLGGNLSGMSSPEFTWYSRPDGVEVELCFNHGELSARVFNVESVDEDAIRLLFTGHKTIIEYIDYALNVDPYMTICNSKGEPMGKTVTILVSDFPDTQENHNLAAKLIERV